MTKLAAKVPDAVKTVVSTTQDRATVWYARPRALGTIEFRKNYWFTADGGRFVSSRDAMEYLIKLYELETVAARLPTPTQIALAKPAPAPKPAPTETPVAPPVRTGASLDRLQDPFVKELIEYLRRTPEVQALLGRTP